MLDVGGEGRHPGAWNLNPRARRTLGPSTAQRIPRLILGRGEQMPFADGSIDVVIVERTPLREATLKEIRRVARPAATIVLRHVITPAGDPHRLALAALRGNVARRMTFIGRIRVRETTVVLEPAGLSSGKPGKGG